MANLIDLNSYLYKHFNDKLNVVYDIGASDGRYSSLINLSVTNKPKFYLFDANSEYINQQHSYDFEFHNVVFSDRQKTVDFYSNGTGGDSYYIEFTGIYNDVTPVKRQTESLDDYCLKNNIPLPDLIKIDTQGSELDILMGGKKSLEHAKVVILECPILEYNINAPTFNQYIHFMRTNNYLPHAAVELHWLNGILVQMDIAFINTKKES